MTTLARSDQSVVGRWWWTVDRWTLVAIVLLVGVGILLIQAATPAVATKHGWGTYYFVQRHLAMLVPAAFMLVGVSLLSPRKLLLLSAAMLPLFLALLVATLFSPTEVKGATRWIQLSGFSFQPSEFVKPFFAIVTAWLFARHCETKAPHVVASNAVIYAFAAICLLGQPDVGMCFLLSAMWFGQFFLAGLPLFFVGVTIVGGIGALFAAYYIFPHFASRFDRFLTHSGDTYQTDRALDAFAGGGLLGTGPGSGKIKMTIPDAHSDFVFAVAGEELGLICCLLIIALYIFIVWRGISRARQENNLFILLAISGLLIEFGLQAAINLASTLHLIPTKGMTLPFLSYGGSSLWALALEMGMLLALTRKRYGAADI